MGLRGFEEQGGRYEGGRGKVSTRFLAFVSYVQRLYRLSSPEVVLGSWVYFRRRRAVGFGPLIVSSSCG